MDSGASGKKAAGPPPVIIDELRRRLPEREVEGLQTLFALRGTAQQVDNALAEWMAGPVGSFARYQILMALWASKDKGLPHKEIVAAMGVTRATVSGLMAGLERDGLVKSSVDREDRRKQIARLTAKGRTVTETAFEASLARFRAVFAALSSDELTGLNTLLRRLRDGFVAHR
jgi:DNA-binding MarR family transcriptional regulator